MEDRSSIRYRVEYRQVPQLPAMPGEARFRGEEYNVYQDETGNLYRCFHDHADGDRPYAVTSYDLPNRRVLIEYLSGAEKFFCETGNSFFHTGWETLLLREHRLILHASCVSTPYGGLLFSGPSGIGKSTQAALWEEYGGGWLINGDRPILRPTEEGWLAYGSPYAGSSHCHLNECCPVRAIVLLRQAPACTLRPLKGMEAFRRVFQGLTVNSWDGENMALACDLAQKLVTEVPVCELSCTPDAAAVELLRQALEGGTL